MSPYRKRIIFRALGVLLAGCAVLMSLPAVSDSAAEPDREDVPLPGGMSAPTKKSPIHLYFAGRNSNFLMAEQRVVFHPDDPAGLADAIVKALIKGPQRGLLKTIPADTQLRALYITPDGTCYVDLSGAVRKNHPGGSKSELLTIYSMVNSLVLNVPEIERVQILIEGNEAPTLAGHIDLQLPVKANMLLIR
ncbi:MAG: GerMN domain-containing protein [Desulfobacterales bacterium]